ncbi:MAG: helix-turn-helix transcriptional regulator [Lawsonibacter sp.]
MVFDGQTVRPVPAGGLHGAGWHVGGGAGLRGAVPGGRRQTGEPPPPTPWDRSPEYWTGWALAYYQWERGLSFGEIQRLVPITAVRAMYVPYHEMDVRQFADRMDQLCRAAQGESTLKRLRLTAGMSQSELAKQSGVPVRTIQQYEQGQKLIDHARGETLLRLARALACSMEDILENRPAFPEEVS